MFLQSLSIPTMLIAVPDFLRYTCAGLAHFGWLELRVEISTTAN